MRARPSVSKTDSPLMRPDLGSIRRQLPPSSVALLDAAIETVTGDADLWLVGGAVRDCAAGVPLRDVVGAAQVVLQTARLQVASGLELAETLVTDLIGFDPKPVARDMDLRGGRNADLVLALAVAVWERRITR